MTAHGPVGDLDAALNEAADRLLSLIVRTRFRNPGTSADPYVDSMILWLSVVREAREVLSPWGVPASTLCEVEHIYREAVQAWLRGDEPQSPVTDDRNLARALSDDDLHGSLRQVLDPPTVWSV